MTRKQKMALYWLDCLKQSSDQGEQWIWVKYIGNGRLVYDWLRSIGINARKLRK